jgi:hypothetical protein
MSVCTRSAFNDLFTVDLMQKTVFAVIILLITVLLANLAASLIKRYAQKIKHLTERFRVEGIVIPYPIRAINYSQEKAQ